MTEKYVRYTDLKMFADMKGEIFIEHIRNHLKQDEQVICKICGKNVDTIAEEEVTRHLSTFQKNIMEEDFKRLLENNKDKDWNNPIFRETMADAFRFCANKHIEKLKLEVSEEAIEDFKKNVYPELKLINEYSGEMVMQEWMKRHLSTFQKKSDIIADKQNPQDTFYKFINKK